MKIKCTNFFLPLCPAAKIKCANISYAKKKATRKFPIYSNCLVLFVTPPLMFTVTSFLVMPMNRLVTPAPPSVNQCSKCDTQNLCEQNFCITSYILFHLTDFLSVGMVNILQVCHTNRSFMLSLHTFSSNLQTFPQ